MSRQKQFEIGIPSSLYRPLTRSAVDQVAKAALEVLAKSGMAVYSETGFEALRKAGAQVDEATRIVRFPRAMIEDAVAANPSSVTLYSRDGENDAVLTENKVHYGTGGTAIYVLDPDSGQRRPSQLTDVALNARMVEHLENIHVFTINVFPNEIKEQDAIDINRFFHALDNTRKHVMGGVYSLSGCHQVVAMAERIAGGSEALRRHPFVSFITLIISPFKIDNNYGEMTCYLAGKGLPVVVPTEPICGTTSPVTLAGNILTHTAETLGGIAMVQAVRRGAPGICGSVGSITNLQTMDHVGGAIERAMINAGVAQMAQHFALPLYSTAGTSDAKSVDIQAAYESAMSSLLVAMSGANYIHDIAGLMETDLTVAYDKLVIDNEILGMCQRVLRGIEVNDETLASELLIEKGPAQDYMVEDHTIRHMHEEFYRTTISNRQKRDDYSEQESALARARRKVAEIRAGQGQSLLPPEIRAGLVSEFDKIRDLP